jgi:hypothetical protein
VLLGTPLHASSNFTVSVQLADKRGFTKKKKKKKISMYDRVFKKKTIKFKNALD